MFITHKSFSIYPFFAHHRGIPQWSSRSDARVDCNPLESSRSWCKNSALKVNSTKDSATPWRASVVWKAPCFHTDRTSLWSRAKKDIFATLTMRWRSEKKGPDILRSVLRISVLASTCWPLGLYNQGRRIFFPNDLKMSHHFMLVGLDMNERGGSSDHFSSWCLLLTCQIEIIIASLPGSQGHYDYQMRQRAEKCCEEQKVLSPNVQLSLWPAMTLILFFFIP